MASTRSLVSRVSTIAATALLGFFALSGVAAGWPERLYISTFQGYNGAHVRAYEIVDGLATRDPILDYRLTSGPLAVGPGGELFADNDKRSEYNETFGITAFFSDSTRLARSFFPRIGKDCSALVGLPMLAVSETLYFGFSCNPPGSMPRGRGPRPDAFPQQGVFVYDVTSPMKQRLLNIIPMPNVPTGLALNARGELYVGDFYGGRIDVFSDPRSRVKLVRTILGTSFHGPGRAPGALWIDDTGELYVFNFGLGTVSVYDDTASGTVAPERTISPAGYNVSPWGYIAISSHTLFMTYQVNSVIGVAAFDKRIDGTQEPLQVLRAPNIYQGITVGR
jgi:DNA-binding beta-propeller fold protein YncE